MNVMFICIQLVTVALIRSSACLLHSETPMMRE